MTVAFVLADPFPVVSETFILNQITGLLDRGHDVRMFAQRPTGALAHADVARYGLIERTTYWPSFPRHRGARVARALGMLARHPALARTLDPRFGRDGVSLQLLYRASSLAPRRAFDAVLCHFGWNGNLAVMLRRAGVLGGPLVTFFHGADVSLHLDARPDLYRALFREGALFLPISEHWRRKLVRHGAPEVRTHVHRMGIDCGRFAFVERRPSPGAPLRLLSVSRLVEKKGILFGVRAVARLAAQGLDLRYEIIGDGPLRESIEREAARLGMADRVTVSGWQDQSSVRAAIDRAHVLLAPSVTAADGDQEGIPVVLMEAMAAGLPVVSSRHSGIPELVEDRVSGRLVAERDDAALADAIAEMVAAPDEAIRMSRAARARVERRFDVRGLNDRLVERLEGLAHG